MSKNDSQFIHFQSSVDLNAVLVDRSFTSTWHIRNNGTTTWKLGYHLLNYAQGLMVRKRIPLFEATGRRQVSPGEELDITLIFRAPKRPGQYKHVFQMAADNGKAFGDQYWVEAVVVAEEEGDDDKGLATSPVKDRLQFGMNISPDAPFSNPTNVGVLTGLDWVRYPFKVDDKSRSIADSFAEYDPIVKNYARKGIGTLFVLNQQTVTGKNAPWKGRGDWTEYASQFASAASEIAAHYARLGEKVAFEIWNEGDNKETPWVSVYIPPKHFAPLLWRTASAIRQVSPESKIVFGGLSTDHKKSGDYVKQVKRALGGELPVDAIGIHPYGRWPVKRPFKDWGYGSLSAELAGFAKQIPDKPLWITEIGIVGGEKPLPEETQHIVAQFMEDLIKTIAQKHADHVPVVIWFAWSDNMHNAGIVRADGTAKKEILDAFIAVRDKKMEGLA